MREKANGFSRLSDAGAHFFDGIHLTDHQTDRQLLRREQRPIFCLRAVTCLITTNLQTCFHLMIPPKLGSLSLTSYHSDSWQQGLLQLSSQRLPFHPHGEWLHKLVTSFRSAAELPTQITVRGLSARLWTTGASATLHPIIAQTDHELDTRPRNKHAHAETKASNTTYKNKAHPLGLRRPYPPGQIPNGTTINGFNSNAQTHADRRGSFNNKYEDVLAAKNQYKSHVEQSNLAAEIWYLAKLETLSWAPIISTAHEMDCGMELNAPTPSEILKFPNFFLLDNIIHYGKRICIRLRARGTIIFVKARHMTMFG
ncbi:uncharacterized protein CLUP02_08955 [Colletotrichum lupini]|uniref:Uncharacterized protein n=1 Tax=Colletotrichum lupini TaxID=145971 RepID=A0A9Q8SU22_9PEZI|nr:uncharacterized protein CLUP02_08955 [Colletotrichum lupini]UQC83460.1 hypothetical protein CLUP02_08955 [Colletotrichum lupini]